LTHTKIQEENRKFIKELFDSQLPKHVKMVELFARDGIQHERKILPTETKVFFINQFSECGFDTVEVTNFAHPRWMPQFRDAEEVLRGIKRKPGVKYKCYAMTKRAFERAVKAKDEGLPVDICAFTISTTDEHCMRNANRTVEQFLKEIPAFVELCQGAGITIDMAIASVFGCPITGNWPWEKTTKKAMWLIEKGLEMGIKKFTPCDTTGEANPKEVYEFYCELHDRFPDADCHLAHFHDTRGMGLANTLAAILGGAEIVEASLGGLGGQPTFFADGIVPAGTGTLYTFSDLTGNCSTEDTLVMLDEMGVDTGVDIDRVLGLGRLLEWVLERDLRPYSTKSGRVLKKPLKWALQTSPDQFPFISWEHIPPYKQQWWCWPRE